MKKRTKRALALMLVALTAFGMPQPIAAAATEDTEVVITLDDKPYLALGGDLTADEQHTVLSLMGVEAADFDQYDVVYVTNAEEHQYLDSYISSDKIGTRALSSVLISLADEGEGLSVSTYNINYCTKGMYKNALATAGVEDANVIVAGPFELSGTAALVGTLEAYEKLTGETLDESVVDAAMNELVTTGELEESIDGSSEDIEAMVAQLKEKLANGELSTTEDIREAIAELADEYDLTLTEEDEEKLISLLEKLQGLDLDWDSIKSQASAWTKQLESSGVLDVIGDFFKKLFEAIKEWFSA